MTQLFCDRVYKLVRRQLNGVTHLQILVWFNEVKIYSQLWADKEVVVACLKLPTRFCRKLGQLNELRDYFGAGRPKVPPTATSLYLPQSRVFKLQTLEIYILVPQTNSPQSTSTQMCQNFF